MGSWRVCGPSCSNICRASAVGATAGLCLMWFPLVTATATAQQLHFVAALFSSAPVSLMQQPHHARAPGRLLHVMHAFLFMHQRLLLAPRQLQRSLAGSALGAAQRNADGASLCRPRRMPRSLQPQKQGPARRTRLQPLLRVRDSGALLISARTCMQSCDFSIGFWRRWRNWTLQVSGLASMVAISQHMRERPCALAVHGA